MYLIKNLDEIWLNMNKKLKPPRIIPEPLTKKMQTVIFSHFEDEVANRRRDEFNVVIFKSKVFTQNIN